MYTISPETVNGYRSRARHQPSSPLHRRVRGAVTGINTKNGSAHARRIGGAAHLKVAVDTTPVRGSQIRAELIGVVDVQMRFASLHGDAGR